MQTTRMPMLVTDPHQPDNPVVFANNAFLTMTGYAPEEFVGRNCRFLQGPMTDPLAVAEIREAIKDRRDVSVELLNYRKDGSTFWNALFVSPVFNERKELVYYFSSQLDVSARRDSQSALAQAQKMEALGQLTGGIAHDFNNLLQVISGHLELLGMRLVNPSIDIEASLAILNKSKAAVARGASLTQQMLTFARKQRLVGRTLNLNQIARDLTDTIENVFKEVVTVNMVLQPDLPNCQIDPTQIEMALLNLIRNAHDAMQDEKTLTVVTGVADVGPDKNDICDDLDEGQYVTISITDNGHGIPANFLNRVLDPFFTTKEEGKGTGLGLSMVYGFAKQSGGTAKVYSEVGIGTTVRLYFPVTANSLVKPSIQSTPPQLGGHEHIFVVDDREEVAHLCADMLKGLGYNVSIAYSAAQALKVQSEIGPVRIDLLFTDLIMPGGMNGIQLAKEMQKLRPDISVLLTTGYAGDPFSSTPEEAGHEYRVLTKPYRMADLARAVRSAIDS